MKLHHTVVDVPTSCKSHTVSTLDEGCIAGLKDDACLRRIADTKRTELRVTNRSHRLGRRTLEMNSLLVLFPAGLLDRVTRANILTRKRACTLRAPVREHVERNLAQTQCVM